MLALTSLWLGHTECRRAANMQHICSMFPAGTGSVLHWCCGTFERSPDPWGTSWKGPGANFYFLQAALPILLPLGVKCSEIDLIKGSDISTGAAAQGLNLRPGRGEERDGAPKDCRDTAVLPWINGSAISVHYKPHPLQHYLSSSVAYTQERHTAITFVWGPKN